MKSFTLRAAGAAVALAATLAVASPAMALTTRYEAETYFSTATSGAKAVITSAGASGGKYLALYSDGYVEVPAYTAVKSMTAAVKGDTCKSPAETKPGYAEYMFRTYPAYVQHDAFVNPDPATMGFETWGSGSTFNPWTFTLPYGGYGFGPLYGGGAPNRVQVRFKYDYNLWVNGVKKCDRNLYVDYIDVVS